MQSSGHLPEWSFATQETCFHKELLVLNFWNTLKLLPHSFGPTLLQILFSFPPLDRLRNCPRAIISKEKFLFHPVCDFSLPWALETVSPLVMRLMFLAGRWQTQPLWILSSSLKGNSVKCSGKALNSPNPPSKEKWALHQPRIYLGSWKCFCFQRWFLIKWGHLVSFPVVPQEIDN